MNEQCCNAIPSKPTLYHKYITIKNNIKNWLLLNIWYKVFYVRVMKLMHKYDMHYMPESILSKLENKVQRYHRCSWCGLNGYRIEYSLITTAPQQQVPVEEKE